MISNISVGAARVGLTRAALIFIRCVLVSICLHACQHIFGGVIRVRYLLRLKIRGIVSALPDLILFCLTNQFL